MKELIPFYQTVMEETAQPIELAIKNDGKDRIKSTTIANLGAMSLFSTVTQLIYGPLF